LDLGQSGRPPGNWNRLYAQELEQPQGNRPERALGEPLRPVPKYFFYAGPITANDKSGLVRPTDDLGRGGDLRIYSEDGLPIDALAVASHFGRLMTINAAIQFVFPAQNPQAATAVEQMVTSILPQAQQGVVRLHLADAAGQPYNGANLTGVTAVNAATGISTLNQNMNGTIAKANAGGQFTTDVRQRLLLGPATSGRLTDTFTPVPLPANVMLPRDFFSIRVLQLNPYLLGTRNPQDNATPIEPAPMVRMYEPLNFLTDGNQVAAANDAIPNAAQPTLCVAQALNGNFQAPTGVVPNVEWPLFTGVPTLNNQPLPPTTAPLPIGLRNGFNPTAQYFDDGNPNTANVDVILTLHGLPPNAWVRVYPRKFISDAREARGDGKGLLVPANGTVILHLVDPLGLTKTPNDPPNQVTIPLPATLRFDLVVIEPPPANTVPVTRIYGNVATTITTTTNVDAPGGANRYNTATWRGITTSGVLGLGQTAPLPNNPTFLQVLQFLTGEGQPRNATRLPTMARRDLLAASLNGGNWTGVISGGRLTPEVISGNARIGCPGGLGGRETQQAASLSGRSS